MEDLIIIGGGPAGLSAGIYAPRAGLKTTLLEGSVIGGQLMSIHSIENYPGIRTDGPHIAEEMREQVTDAGTVIHAEVVKRLTVEKGVKHVITNRSEYDASTIIIATGASPLPLGLYGEKRLVGHGISYCASCDGALFKRKNVAVIGSGNTAVSEAVLLSQYCKEVHLIYRKSNLKADESLQKQLRSLPVILHPFCEVIALKGSESLTGIVLNNGTELHLDGLFVSIGRAPNSTPFTSILKADAEGFILTNDKTETFIPGIYAAGDVRSGAYRQIVTAASDGATAAHQASLYLH